MAKLAFSKLNKIKSIPEVITELDGNELRIKQYLPLAEKLQLLINVLELAGADEGYFNLIKLEVFYKIEVIKNYTNISFTDKQMEDPTKLYDSIVLNGIWEEIELQVPQKELVYVWDCIYKMAKAITDYNRSFAGMMQNISTNYGDLDKIVSEVQEKVNAPELKELISAFGQNS